MHTYPKRRSFLGILASTGLLSSVGIQAPAEAAANTTATATAISDSVSTPEGQLIGVELIDKKTNERSFYRSLNEVRNQSLPEGQYELLIVFREGEQIVTQSEQVTVDQQQQQLTTDGETDELRAFVPSETVYDYYAPDDTVVAWVGAAGIENDEPRSPTEGVAIEAQLQDPEDNQIDSTTATTGPDGNASIEFNLANLNNTPNGRYTVTVSADGYNSTTTSFNVGPYISTPFHWTGMTVNQQTTIGFYTALGGTPQSNVEYDISIDGPEDSSVTESLSFSEGGIGLLDFTPTDSGSYRFDADASDEYGESYESAELKALAPYFEIRDQYVNTTVSWCAHVVSDKLPVADLDLTVTVTDDADSVVSEQTVTTNDFGQFTVEFVAPDSSMDYDIELEAVDGRSIFLFGDRVGFEELPQETGDSTIEVDVDFNEYQVGPNTDQGVSVRVEDEDTPVTDATIDLVFSMGWDGLPAGSTELQTDSNGEASTTVSIPGESIDGERFYATAFYDTDSDTITGSDSVSIEKYDIEIDDFLERGTNTVSITATERATGNAASGVDVTLFGNRYNVDLETFDAGYAQTNSNGVGSVELTVPEDVTNDIMVNELTPYSSTSSSGGGFSDPISAEVTVTPESPAVGDTITVSYTTNSEADVSALASFPEDEGADTIILEEGQEGEFVVPDYIDPGSYESLSLLLLATDGEAAEDGTGIEIAEGLNANFSYTPANPTAGEELTFDAANSSNPDGTIDSYEWDFTGDGTTDRTGQQVSYTFTNPDSYDVELTVTGDGGETDTATGAVSVSVADSTPFFSVDIADPSDGEQVREDQELTVIANVTNTGTANGTQTISLTAPIQKSVEVADLSADETERVEFTVPQDNIAGEFDISVQTEDTTDTVSVDGFDPCFIATAAYGTPTATEIDVLRDFRDDVLRRNRLGVFMIQLYYRTSPPIADWVRQTDRRQQLIKDYLVSPLVESVRSLRSR